MASSPRPCYGEVSGLCRRAGISRQNYYACRRVRERRLVDEELVVELVRRERRLQPRLGGRKLYFMLQKEFAENNISIGRDRFFEILKQANLLVERKPCRARTTDSRHCLPVFHNLFSGKSWSGPNQAWVSDLTYIRTEHDFLYTALITDAYSRKIVGYHIGDSLEAQGCIGALEMALKGLPAGQRPIHHSDRGIQYCCHAYVDILLSRQFTISMTEILHCYENSMAERVNGTLKDEYEMNRTFRTKEQAKAALDQAVMQYNHRRPHLSLKYRCPADVHAQVA
ncbi:MAG: IS3 family transposase [Verrucomicrobiota bacterium]|nr:IS3 family transposase [Verrucomicrobiota bacterium]